MRTLKKKHGFQAILDVRLLRRLGGERSFERGQEYFENKRVSALVERDGVITAEVRGTHPYIVKLRIDGGRLGYSCTCPIGNGGEFCKHCVAAGLAWLEAPEGLGQTEKGRTPAPKSSSAAITMEDVQAFLARQQKNDLIKILLEQARDDERLRQRLLVRASKRNPKSLDLSSYKGAIAGAIDPGHYVDYRGMFAYARDIEEAIAPLAELLEEGKAAEVIELAEYALAAVENALGSVDDSDGQMGDILARLQELHLRACRRAKPDPELLAQRLFRWELRTDWDTFFGAAQTYAGVLGKKGLAVYRELAEAEWAKLPLLPPGGKEPGRYDGRRFRITSIMETLAKHSRDPEALVAVIQKDLSHEYSFLRIAEIYKNARRTDLALDWAERGVRAFPERTDSRLRVFLANEYYGRKRHDEAMALIWLEFAESPSLGQYEILKRHADRLGRWPLWREKALLFLQEHLAKDKQRERKGWGAFSRSDHSVLVEIYLWENEVEAAWREAQKGGCSDDLLLKLAALREKAYPEDALAVYRNRIEPLLNQKIISAYREALRLLHRIHSLMNRMGQGIEFAPYLESIRLAHRAKRNFMKLLDHADWRKAPHSLGPD